MVVQVQTMRWTKLATSGDVFSVDHFREILQLSVSLLGTPVYAPNYKAREPLSAHN